MRNIPRTLAVAALLLASQAHAASFTLDAPNPTIVRPASGTGPISLDFFGTLTLDPGDSINYMVLAGPHLSGAVLNSLGQPDVNDRLAISALPTFAQLGNAARFRVTVSETNNLGLYDDDLLDYFGFGGIARISYGLGPLFNCCTADNYVEVAGANFSVRVVDAPEPASLGLMAAGLAGLAALRRRRCA